MMISLGVFYDEMKDKSVEEIKTEIRRLKRSITKLMGCDRSGPEIDIHKGKG